jgi:hypothetical protein
MNDSEWFRLNPERLVRRRRLQGDPEMWILSLHDTSETLLVQGRLPCTDVSDAALHDIATELLIEGAVGAERIQQALRLAQDAGPMKMAAPASKAGVDPLAVNAPPASRVVWPSYSLAGAATAETDPVERL